MSTFSLISILATILLVVMAPAQGIVHLALAGLRRLRGRPWRFDWQVIGRSAVVLGTLALAALLFVLDGKLGLLKDPLWQRVAGTVMLGAIVACFLVPLWYLASAYAKSKGRFIARSYAIALLSLAATPAAAAFLYLASMMTIDVVTDHTVTDFEELIDLKNRGYVQAQSGPPSKCATLLHQVNPMLDQTPNNFDALVMFWLDQSLGGAFFDLSDTFECRLSPYDNNPNDLRFSALVVAYRFFAELILVSVLIWPLLPLFRKKS